MSTLLMSSEVDAAPAQKEISPQKPKIVKRSNTFKEKIEPSPLDDLIRKNRREKRQGLDSAYYSGLLDDIHGRADDADSTSGSLPDVGNDLDVSMNPRDFRKLAKELPDDLADDDLLMELTDEKVHEKAWAGFWEGDEPVHQSHEQTPDVVTPTLEVVGLKGRLLLSAVEAQGGSAFLFVAHYLMADFASIAFLVALPGTLATLQKGKNLAELFSWSFARREFGLSQ